MEFRCILKSNFLLVFLFIIFIFSDIKAIDLKYDVYNTKYVDSIPVTILLNARANYILGVTIGKVVKKEKCKCLSTLKCCYLYTMAIDSILYMENSEAFKKEELRIVSFFSTDQAIYREGRYIIGEFFDTQNDGYIYLNRVIPTDGNRILSFDKEYISLTGKYECQTYKGVPFAKYLKRIDKKRKAVFRLGSSHPELRLTLFMP